MVFVKIGILYNIILLIGYLLEVYIQVLGNFVLKYKCAFHKYLRTIWAFCVKIKELEHVLMIRENSGPIFIKLEN